MNQDLMKRKINRVGANTLTVSLPSAWAKKHKLKPGQDIDVSEFEKSLVLSLQPSKRESIYSLHIPTGKFLFRYVERPYIAGYDEIKLTFDNYEILADLQDVIPRLIGVDIIQQSAKSCTAKVFVTEEMKDIKKTMISVFCVIKMMFDNLIDSLRNNKFENLKKLKSLDDSVSRLTNLSLRLVNKGNVPGEVRLSTYYTSLARELEHMGDHFIFISQVCSFQKNAKVNQELMSFLNKTKACFEILYDIYVKPKWEKMQVLQSTRFIHKSKIHNLFKKLNYNESIILSRMLNLHSDITHACECVILLELF